MCALLFQKKQFVFNIKTDMKPLADNIPKEVVSIIWKFHKKQKRTFERFAKELCVKCKRDFRDNAKKVKTACLELSVLYHHFFSKEFEKNDISPSIRKLYFFHLYENFSDMQPVLENLEYTDINDFFKIKEDYYEQEHLSRSRLELSHYYYHTFARFPLMKPENYKELPQYFDYVDSWKCYIFFLDTTGKIRKEAEEMVQALSSVREHIPYGKVEFGHT